MDIDNLEIHYFTTFYFLVAITSFFFLGKIIKFIKSLHPFLKKHNALSRTMSIAIIVGLSRGIGIPVQKALEHVFGAPLEYSEEDILQGFLIGKTLAFTLLIILLIYFLK
jgi:hypothetical protein